MTERPDPLAQPVSHADLVRVTADALATEPAERRTERGTLTVAVVDVPQRIAEAVALATFLPVTAAGNRAAIRPGAAGLYTFVAERLTVSEAGRAIRRYKAWLELGR